MNPIKVLAIDGGGIRGVIPAVVLAAIENLTGRPISSLFDMVAGTSTGGILALGITRPGEQGKPAYSAEQLALLYEKEGKQIFSRSVWRRLRAVGSLRDEKYSSDGIDKVLEDYFGESRLKDALTEVLITSYEIERRIPFFFKSRNAVKREDYDFPMKMIARATSAAPTYFEPLKLDSNDANDYYALIDGGVFANNPAMCAVVEAKAMHPEATDFLVVSLGTGEMTRRLPYDEVKDWGLARWAQPILNVVLGGVSDTVDYQLKQLLPPGSDGAKRYYRFQTRLGEVNDDMDDASPENVRTLRLLAESVVRERSDDLKLLCGQLLG